MKHKAVSYDNVPDNVLLPVGNARVLVGRRGALLLVPVPPAVRVHRVQAGLLARESSHIINMYYILCVQEVVTPIYIMSYYINWGNYFLDTRYNTGCSKYFI